MHYICVAVTRAIPPTLVLRKVPRERRRLRKNQNFFVMLSEKTAKERIV
jgi:hypothetical protein